MVDLQALFQCHIACSVLPWLLSPENSNVSLKKGTSLWGANITPPWRGIKRQVTEHEVMLGNTVQKQLRGRRVGNIFEGKMSFSYAASLCDLHLWGHSQPADFQEVTAHNSIVNVEYVSSLKLLLGEKRHSVLPEKNLYADIPLSYFSFLFQNLDKVQFIPLKYVLHIYFSTSKPDKHSHVQTQKYICILISIWSYFI